MGEFGGMSLYVFARNCPMAFVDPKGLEVVIIQASELEWTQEDQTHLEQAIKNLKDQVTQLLDFLEPYPETRKIFINNEEMTVEEARNRISELLPREDYPILQGETATVLAALAGIFSAATPHDIVIIMGHKWNDGVLMGLDGVPLETLAGAVSFAEQDGSKSVMMDCCYISSSEAEMLHDKLKANYLYYFATGLQKFRLDGWVEEKPTAANGHRIKIKIEFKSNRLLLFPPDASGAIPISPVPVQQQPPSPTP
jgi:hypothetical protein